MRNIKIEVPHWTTCKDFRKDTSTPTGPVYAIVCEVKDGTGAYIDIPYFRGRRAETHQEGGGDTVIRFEGPGGKTIELPDAEAYLEYYERNK